MSVVVYSRENCTACQVTIKSFERAGIDQSRYEVKRIDDYPKVLETAREKGMLSLPLVEKDGELVSSGAVMGRKVEAIFPPKAPTKPESALSGVLPDASLRQVRPGVSGKVMSTAKAPVVDQSLGLVRGFSR